MRLDRLDAEIQLGGDILRRPAFGDELQHLALTRRQSLEGIGLIGDAPPEVRDQVLGHGGAQIRLAARDRRDGQLQLREAGVLEEVSRGARPERLEGILLGGVHRQDDDRGARMALDDARGRLEPVETGHRDVHEDQAWMERLDEPDDLVSVTGLGHDFDAGDRREQGSDAGTHERVVIGEDDADRRHPAVPSAPCGHPAGASGEGSHARTVVPRPGADSMADLPPASSTRSSSPKRPMLAPCSARRRAAVTSKPTPSSWIDSSNPPTARARVTEIRVARAWRTTLVTAS